MCKLVKILELGYVTRNAHVSKQLPHKASYLMSSSILNNLSYDRAEGFVQLTETDLARQRVWIWSPWLYSHSRGGIGGIPLVSISEAEARGHRDVALTISSAFLETTAHKKIKVHVCSFSSFICLVSFDIRSFTIAPVIHYVDQTGLTLTDISLLWHPQCWE